jgi:FSR family fosmidomycin resistance protein-like MFS transporter
MILVLPLLLGLAHGVSDASAGLLVGRIIQQKSPEVNTLILLYNLLAFALQPFAGMLFDHLHLPKPGACFGLLLTMTGVLTLQANLNLAIILIGLGSACLHAGGGSLAITATPGKASSPGVFAAFGVIGLALGGMASLHFLNSVVAVLAALLALLGLIIWFMPQNADTVGIPANTASPLVPEIFIILLVLAIAFRSAVWVGAQQNVERYSSTALGLALAAGLGKLIGGFCADRLGWMRWIQVSMVGALVMLVFSSQWLPGLIAGVFLLQSMTPLSIAAIGRALPRYPALAASLALGVAVIAGGLPFFIFSRGWFSTGMLLFALGLSGLIYWVFLRKISSAL